MARTGRPTRLHEVVRLADGRTVTVRDSIVDWLRRGQPYGLSIARAGVSTGTVEHWLRQAARAEAKLAANPDTELTDHELDLIEFSRDVEQARAEGQAMFEQIMSSLATGGRTREVIREKVEVDAQGRERTVERTTTTETTLPDFRAVQWVLENRYGRRAPTELVVAGALPVEERAHLVADAIESWLVHEQHKGEIDAGPSLT